MLLGEQLSWRHHRCLKTSFRSTRGSECGHDCLATAHIPLHEPQHRTGLREVALDFLPRAQLRARQIERQRVRKSRDQRLRVAGREGPARVALNFAAKQAQTELVREQAQGLERPLIRPVAASTSTQMTLPSFTNLRR